MDDDILDTDVPEHNKHVPEHNAPEHREQNAPEHREHRAPEQREHRPVHHNVHHAHHTTHRNDQLPWMLICALLAVLLIVSLYLNYSLVTANPTAPSAPAAPVADNTVTAPTGEGPAKANIQLKADDHIKGDKDAKVLIVEYSDFQCPFCAKVQPTVAQIEEEYGEDVALVFRHYPLSFHPNAVPAALASECAAEQGKFWEYHDILFENQNALTEADLMSYAKTLKLDEDQFSECYKSQKYQDKVDADFSQGQTDGVTGTPAFFINGQKIAGAYPFAAFKQIIDGEL